MRRFVCGAVGFFGCVALLSGCAGRQLQPEAPPEQLYAAAEQAIAEEDYDLAREALDRIRDEFPFSAQAVDAELLAADMAYQEEKFEEAAALYRSFEELHPTHPKVPYALFQRGLSYLELSQPPERDQSQTRNAAEALQKLLYAYPKSAYADQARDRLVEVRLRLAQHEMHVARYYIRRKKLQAALGRLQGLVADYPDTALRAEAEELAADVWARMEKAEQ